LNVLTLQ